MKKRLLITGGLLIVLTACGGGAAPATSGSSDGSMAAPTGTGKPAAIMTATPGAAISATTSATRGTPVSAAIPPVTGTVITKTAIAAIRATPAANTTPARGTPRALPAATPVTFAKAPWAVGEKTTYTVTTSADGQPAGNATYAIGGEFEAATVSANLTVGETQDRFQIGFNGTTFAPTSELRSIVTAQGTISIQSEFHAGGATIQVIGPNGTVRHQLTLQDPYYINDQFLIILRALPFAQGYQGALAIVPSQGNPAAINTVVTVTGQEQITTPAGTFTCWRVTAEYEGADTAQTLWYSADAAHYLVRYDTGRYTYTLSQKP